jgi:hypothetical protein
MMISKFRRASLLATMSATLALVLSGCVIVHTTKQELLYTPEYVTYASDNGSIPVEIYGNPLGDSQLASEKLLNAINIPHWIAPRKMHPVVANKRGTGHRLVLVFNPASAIASGDSICANPDTPTRKPGDHMLALAALCSLDDNVTRATAEGDVQPGLQDPRFLELLNNLIMEVMPSRNYDHDTTDCQAAPCG